MGGGGGGSSANLMLTDQNYQQIKRVVAPNVAIPVHFNIRTHESGCRKRRYCGDHLRYPYDNDE